MMLGVELTARFGVVDDFILGGDCANAISLLSSGDGFFSFGEFFIPFSVGNKSAPFCGFFYGIQDAKCCGRQFISFCLFP